MRKKIKKLILSLMVLLISFASREVLAEKYVKPNSILNTTGSEQVAQIKKFQAMNNIPVTGKLDSLTKEMLYNPDFQAYDGVTKPPSKGRWIVINTSKRMLTVFNGIWPDVKFPVALGTSFTPTPVGKFKISNMAKNPAWGGMGGKYTPIDANSPNNPLGERWMGLVVPGQSGYGIHGTIKPWEIGKYVSNGCIRLFNYDIETFVFPKMKPGAPVWIGTDEELASWGVYQYIDKKSNNPQSQPEEKPVVEIKPAPNPEEPIEEKPVIEITPVEKQPIRIVDSPEDESIIFPYIEP